MKRILLLLSLSISSLITISAADIVVTNATELSAIGENDNVTLGNSFEINEWTPISNFKGNFDGNNHMITMKADQNPALFGNLDSATIENLRIHFPNQLIATYTKSLSKGGISNNANGATIKNCKVIEYKTNLRIIDSQLYFGCIVGIAKNTRFINNTIVNNKNIIYGEGYDDTPFPRPYVIRVGGICGVDNTSDAKGVYTNNLVINFESQKTESGNAVNIEINSFLPNSNYKFEGSTNLQINDITDKEIEEIILVKKLTPIDISKTTIVSNKKTVIANTESTSLLYNSTDVALTVTGEGEVFFLGNAVGQLTLGSHVKQTGKVTSTSLIMIDGCLIGENGIDNTGEIYYYRQPSVWTGKKGSGGDGSGWETLCVPFNATMVSIDPNDDNAQKSHEPFAPTNNNPSYWLKEFTGAGTNNTVNFTDAASIQAYKPYIISLPGGTDWNNYNLQDREIVFKGYGAVKPNTTKADLSNSGLDFVAHSHLYATGSQLVAYTINNPKEHPSLGGTGTAFHLNNTAEERSFRAAILTPTNGSNAPVLRIGSSTGGATGISQTFGDENENTEVFNIFTEYGNLIIDCEYAQQVTVYHATTGIAKKIVQLTEGRNTVSNLPKGVYIIKGKKVIL